MKTILLIFIQIFLIQNAACKSLKNLKLSPLIDDGFGPDYVGPVKSDADVEIEKPEKVEVKVSASLDKNLNDLRKVIDKSKDAIKSAADRVLSVDQTQLEKSLEKYDELVERIEAEFSKQKFEIGKNIEQRLKQFNESGDDYMRKFKQMTDDYWQWKQAKRIRFVEQANQALRELNDWLTRGAEFVVSLSETGKETVRGVHRNRENLRDNLSKFLDIFEIPIKRKDKYDSEKFDI